MISHNHRQPNPRQTQVERHLGADVHQTGPKCISLVEPERDRFKSSTQFGRCLLRDARV